MMIYWERLKQRFNDLVRSPKPRLIRTCNCSNKINKNDENDNLIEKKLFSFNRRKFHVECTCPPLSSPLNTRYTYLVDKKQIQHTFR